MKIISEALSKYQRRTWIPQVIEGDGSPDDSKFSGTPYLGKGETWPCCAHCGEPMPLFLQLNLDRLPQALGNEFGSGLLQLFYCTNSDPHCESECEAFFPFSQSTLVRVITPDTVPQIVELPESAAQFSVQRIIEWEADIDYPNWEEGQECGIQLSDEEWERLADENFPRAGDKLAGWPNWVQGIEYPRCPVCHKDMRCVFQLDSEDHLSYKFGDAGCGHITQCQIHKTHVAFAWACG